MSSGTAQAVGRGSEASQLVDQVCDFGRCIPMHDDRCEFGGGFIGGLVVSIWNMTR